MYVHTLCSASWYIRHFYPVLLNGMWYPIVLIVIFLALCCRLVWARVSLLMPGSVC